AHIAPMCGCATSLRKTLKAPTITFSTQKSSRVANTIQPKNRTPASGTRFAATSTRALGERRGGGRAGTGGVTAPQPCHTRTRPPRACWVRRGGGSWRRERLDQGPGRGGDLRQPVRHGQVAPARGVRPGPARGARCNDPAGGPRVAARRAAARPGSRCKGGGGDGGGRAGGDHGRGDAGVAR